MTNEDLTWDLFGERRPEEGKSRSPVKIGVQKPPPKLSAETVAMRQKMLEERNAAEEARKEAEAKVRARAVKELAERKAAIEAAAAAEAAAVQVAAAKVERARAKAKEVAADKVRSAAEAAEIYAGRATAIDEMGNPDASEIDTNEETQAMELEMLESIFGADFIRKSPSTFAITLRGSAGRECILNVTYSKLYPSRGPPAYEVLCKDAKEEDLKYATDRFEIAWKDAEGEILVFIVAEWLKDEWLVSF